MKDSPYTVGDVMTRTVVALTSGASFKEIVRTMKRWDVSAMPVLDDSGRVIGVVSEADLLRKEEFRADEPGRPGRTQRPADEAKAEAATAGELMTAPAVTVHPDAGLGRAARLMAQRDVKRLPVVDDDGVLTGIVSRSDLLKVFLRSDEDLAEEVRRRLRDARLPGLSESIRVTVHEGVVTLSGRVQDASLTPLALRLARSVEGVVDVHSALAGPPRRPLLEPDLADEQP
ncbi:CBS domain-containing protein [Streptomyces thermoalcalitolerans]|uniref:CBS domain-containing protein n=1 Tax=Streptomyces thermoalcalitolerans TaxID=65605 RepID=A0ABP4A8K1_9ACTN